MNIDRSKLNSNETGEIEVLNVKLDDKVQNYLGAKGIYQSYHLSKKSWISIILDNTLSDEKIMELVDLSHDNVRKWLYDECVKYNIKFDFCGTGNVFIKDGKTYNIPKAYQRVMALKSELQNPLIYRKKDIKIQPRCKTCKRRFSCNGCKWCGKCNWK